MKIYLKRVVLVTLVFITVLSVAGCALLDSKLNDIKGDLVGNSYTIRTYDNYGNLVMTTTGDKINIVGNPIETKSYSSDGDIIKGYELSSVITINIDGEQIQSCGDTCIFEGSNLRPEAVFNIEDINSHANSIGDWTSITGVVNQYKNMFGKRSVVVIKSQLGQPITAYSGNEIYWEIPDDLPKMTKLMIDGKPLYIHRANFQIIDKELLE
ncbi:DUF5052 family protein [Firmicutes bacterium AM31-12AC]|nr:DUF5052 family protein [Firmicutes bacterium AM31-12AC]